MCSQLFSWRTAIQRPGSPFNIINDSRPAQTLNSAREVVAAHDQRRTATANDASALDRSFHGYVIRNAADVGGHRALLLRARSAIDALDAHKGLILRDPVTSEPIDAPRTRTGGAAGRIPTTGGVILADTNLMALVKTTQEARAAAESVKAAKRASNAAARASEQSMLDLLKALRFAPSDAKKIKQDYVHQFVAYHKALIPQKLIPPYPYSEATNRAERIAWLAAMALTPSRTRFTARDAPLPELPQTPFCAACFTGASAVDELNDGCSTCDNIWFCRNCFGSGELRKHEAQHRQRRSKSQPNRPSSADDDDDNDNNNNDNDNDDDDDDDNDDDDDREPTTTAAPTATTSSTMTTRSAPATSAAAASSALTTAVAMSAPADARAVAVASNMHATLPAPRPRGRPPKAKAQPSTAALTARGQRKCKRPARLDDAASDNESQ